ncbi:MAG: hypothetical protein GKR89_30075 [Candidatus Latescibacteria bacterium]|nr:hypothetical protein [Candidatus Latescibacterota bacterium]
MRRYAFLGGVLALIMLVGCSAYRPAYHISQQYDEFEGYTRVDLSRNYLGGNKDYQLVQLNITEQVSDEGDFSYALNLIYQANNLLRIKDGESLIMLVDGERLGFVAGQQPAKGIEGATYRGAGGSEAAAFAIEPARYRPGRSGHGANRYRRSPYYGYRPGYYDYRPYVYRNYRPNLYLYGTAPYAYLSPRLSPYAYGYDSYYRHGNRRPHDYDRRYSRSNGPVAYQKKTYPISFATLRRIAEARQVKIRVVGQFFVHRYFTDENLAIFKRFVEESAARYSEEGWTNL